MIALIQRVTDASVSVNQEEVARIKQGLLVLLGVERDDDAKKTQRLIERVTQYRVFSDQEGKMNLNVQQIGGEILVVSQFTLPADTQKGTRAGFSKGASPQLAEQCYDAFIEGCNRLVPTQGGRFAQDMQVALINDGPVTFWLQV